ncbi:chromatin structure-remodeling complex subunit RSC7, partial [Coemansia aciculifera]
DSTTLTTFADGSVILPFSDVDMDSVKKLLLRKMGRRQLVLPLKPSKLRALHDVVNKPASDSSGDESESERSESEEVDLPEEDEDLSTLDAAGEQKIDADGYLLGGRSYICAVFRSPYRKNSSTLYIPSTEVCRFTGFRTRSDLMRRHPQDLRLVKISTREKAILLDNLIISPQWARSLYMIPARLAFKVFGAALVLNGQHVVDDYCHRTWERRDAEKGGPPYAPGQVVANMELYHEFRDNYALAQQPKAAYKHAPSLKLNSEQLRELEAEREQHFCVVGSSVELMALVRSWEKHRRAVVRSVISGTPRPVLSGSRIKRPELPPIESDMSIDDDSDDDDKKEGDFDDDVKKVEVFSDEDDKK